jgi:hypothetical protein
MLPPCTRSSASVGGRSLLAAPCPTGPGPQAVGLGLAGLGQGLLLPLLAAAGPQAAGLGLGLQGLLLLAAAGPQAAGLGLAGLGLQGLLLLAAAAAGAGEEAVAAPAVAARVCSFGFCSDSGGRSSCRRRAQPHRRSQEGRGRENTEMRSSYFVDPEPAEVCSVPSVDEFPVIATPGPNPPITPLIHCLANSSIWSWVIFHPAYSRPAPKWIPVHSAAAVTSEKERGRLRDACRHFP